MIINNCKKLYRSIMLSGGSNSSNSSSGNSSQNSNNNSNRINDNNNIISSSHNNNNNSNNNISGSGYNNNNNNNNIKQESSVICKEVFDDGYQPSQEEINDYAIKIGIDPEKEPHLLYLAKDGLMQALPRDWQICYNEKVRAYYYYNTKSKVSQWDHPLDVEYKQLVDTARKQYNSNDLSEDASQIDSGIRSLQGNEDSELLTDISPMISYNKMENSLNGSVGIGGGIPTNKFLLPIDKIKTGSNEFNNEPNNNKYDVIRNKRFEVTNYTNSSQPPPQIGLSLKTDNNYGTGDSLIKNHEKTNYGDTTIKGFTLTGTGSMFLKSNTAGGTGSVLKSSSSIITVDNFKKPTGILNNDNNSSNVCGTGTGTGNVKGILRDSSLTDVRQKGKNDGKFMDNENEERRMVRFNLQAVNGRRKVNFAKKSLNEGSSEDEAEEEDDEDNDDDDDDNNDDDYEDEEAVHVNDIDDTENNGHLNNEFDDGNDGWDFPIENTNGNEANAIGTGKITEGIQKIKLTLNKNISSTSTIKPLLFKNDHNHFSTLSTLKNNTINNTNNIVSTPASGGTVNKPNLLKLFERQTENISQNTIKPLYENTDTESDRSYNDPEDRWRTIKLKLDEEEHNAMENMKIKMQERLDEFKESMLHEERNEEARIRDEMIKNFELKKDKIESELNDCEITKNTDRLSLIVQEENDKLEREKECAIKELRKNMQMEIDRECDVLEKDKQTKCEQLNNENELQLKELQSKLHMKFENIKLQIENENSNKLDDYRENLKLEFEETCKTISIEHKSSVELLQRNHNEILQDLERDLKSEEELLRKENTTNLIQLRDKLNHELEMERNRMRETGESRLYEKLRCEKRLLEDKYRCLKEKYARLKAEVKLSVERRNRRREHQTNNVTTTNTGSETTELTNSNANKHHQSIGNSSMSVTATHTEQHYGGGGGGGANITNTNTTIGVGKPPTTPKLSNKFRDQNMHTDNKTINDGQSGQIDKKFGTAAAKYLTHIQQYHDDTTSISQSDTTISNNYVQQRSNRYLPVLNSTLLGDTGNSDSEAFRCNQESHFNTNNNNINNNTNNNVSRENGRQRKKVFTRMKSASTSRLNSNTRGGGSGLSSEQHQHLLRPCTPVENLRRQLQKLEDLEDQFPDNSLDTTYHLRYPFTDTTKEAKNVDGASSELEFFKHRIHLERDSVRRAKETLRTQRVNFRAKQQEIKHCHRNANNRHTIDQLFQEEKELTDMEVNLHRTRALLGEKVIRLRHLQESLNRAYEKEKRIDFLPNTQDKKYLGISLHNQVHHQVHPSQHPNPKDDVTTISDLSSHSSSGFSSTDFAGTETLQNQQLMLSKQRNNKDMYQESSEIVQNVEQLNAEIREIWEILSKRQAHGLPPPPTTSTTIYHQQQHHHHQHHNPPHHHQQQQILGQWQTNAMQPSITPSINTLNLTQQILPSQSITSATTFLQQQLPSQSIPTLADRLETYRQLASNRSGAGTAGTAGAVGGGNGGVPSASITTLHNNTGSSNIIQTTMIPAISSSLNPANTIVSQSSISGGGYTTSLVERTQEMRNWLRLAKNEHELLNNGQQANL